MRYICKICAKYALSAYAPPPLRGRLRASAAPTAECPHALASRMGQPGSLSGWRAAPPRATATLHRTRRIKKKEGGRALCWGPNPNPRRVQKHSFAFDSNRPGGFLKRLLAGHPPPSTGWGAGGAGYRDGPRTQILAGKKRPDPRQNFSAKNLIQIPQNAQNETK